MVKPKIGIIIGTTRQGRFGDKPARWFHALAARRDDMDYEIVDLRDYPLPLFDEPTSPAWGAPTNEVAQRWGRKMAEMDGYVFITAEYNHGIAGALKNAIDHAYKEFNRKPASFVGYGGVGGARAVEQLRLVCVEVQIAPLRNAVHIGGTELMGMLQGGKTFADYPYLDQSVGPVLDELSWWTHSLKAARDKA
jgi:NAD(P)H-dependent FMN reductase